MRTGRRILGAILLMATFALPAASDVIYDNGGPDQGYIWFSDYSYPPYRVADGFTLESGASVITDIHWWGAYWPGNTPPELDDFTISIYGSSPAAGIPDALVYSNNVGAVSRVDTGWVGWDGLDIYAYSILVDPISLTAGTQYWLEIVNDTNGLTWGWSTASQGDSHAENYGGYWELAEANMAFNLTGDGNGVVPEPASIALVGLGLAGLAGRRFRNRG